MTDNLVFSPVVCMSVAKVTIWFNSANQELRMSDAVVAQVLTTRLPTCVVTTLLHRVYQETGCYAVDTPHTTRTLM